MEVDWPAAVSYLTLTQPSAAANNRLSTQKCANVRVGRWRIIRVIVANTSLFSMFWPFTVIKQATTETLFFQWRPLFFSLEINYSNRTVPRLRLILFSVVCKQVKYFFREKKKNVTINSSPVERRPGDDYSHYV